MGCPVNFALDDLPQRAREYQQSMPEATLTLDLQHVENRTCNTFRGASRLRAKLISKFASFFLHKRQRGDHSIAFYKALFRLLLPPLSP